VFRNFADLEIGDTFVVEMPYGEYEYEIEEIDIVSADDTSVIRSMGEEVLVVTTCYPFEMLGSAPDRAVFYAWPVE
jgi:sortase A